LLPLSDCSAVKNFVRKPVHENRLEHATTLFVDSELLTQNVFSSPRRKIFLFKPSCQQPEQHSWQAARKLMSSQPIFWLNVSILRSMWWSQLACVLLTRNDSTLLTRVVQWILHTMLAVCFPVLSMTALNCCPVDTFSSKTQLVLLRSGSEPTTQISLPKTSGLQIHVTLTPWITMSVGQCWRPITSAIRNWKQLPNCKKSCKWSGTAYLRDQ